MIWMNQSGCLSTATQVVKRGVKRNQVSEGRDCWEICMAPGQTLSVKEVEGGSAGRAVLSTSQPLDRILCNEILLANNTKVLHKNRIPQSEVSTTFCVWNNDIEIIEKMKGSGLNCP